MKLRVPVIAILLLTMPFAGFAGDKAKPSLRSYAALDIEEFDNPNYETKEPMPDDWLPLLREEISQRVIMLHRFQRVTDFRDPRVPDAAGDRILLLRGKITEFTHGNQAARFWIGMGAGKAKIVAMCTFVDQATGEVVWQKKVDGRVIGINQSTQGAIKGLAKEVAKLIAENW